MIGDKKIKLRAQVDDATLIFWLGFYESTQY